ncbi:MAG: D-alanyl-D-alanine carboxypeptidase/D-alanyl-D-alanine-endopeptidase, partial [Acidobacteria bacterium]|nr:D-alanyl-D-alanine carboxypeptidase/D-alanyl-D-alanine-endopeptidase [Acidobacteriota bacterium]
MRVWLLLAGIAAWCASPLAHRIEELWKSDPAAARAVWGVCALDAETGKPLLGYNSTHYFVPASNTKLLTTALALTRLGPGFRFRTRLTAHQDMDASGVLNSDLRLVGDGDPNLSGRLLPYQKNSIPGDPLLAIEKLVSELERKGLKEVRGDILGDDLAYVWEPYPAGWAVDDTVSNDGAPVSAISLNDNEIAVTVGPGPAPGQPAAILVRPALDYFVIDNRVVTGRAGEESRVEAGRAPGSNQVQLWGAIGARDPAVVLHLAVDDPALFAAAALRDAL